MVRTIYSLPEQSLKLGNCSLPGAKRKPRRIAYPGRRSQQRSDSGLVTVEITDGMQIFNDFAIVLLLQNSC
jgi:hypothetical protein